MTDLLAADTAMGAVTLSVANLDALTAYYRDAVALTVLSESSDTVVLGRGTTPVVILKHSPALKHASPRDAGLFHTAILFDTEEALAASVYSVATRYPKTFTGSADHLVSKAFYFTDPEGNGVELYWDRDRTQWSWTHGAIEMGTLFLDPNGFLQEHLTEAAVEQPVIGGARVGHVHLQVGDVATAREFYVNQLGFEATTEIPGSAVFVSAGGYHHHMAMNTWNSSGAGPRLPALGLAQIDIAVPSADDLGALGERMTHHGIPLRHDGQTLSFDDPWANQIRVSTAP
ncbi:catechol 2,3-dioxygenase [Salinibacterium amurskyense]|uniref:Catechol 2,3-dioxygenase n=1 Tax=Salinibacterium amurskyense TaxID=205941 RepID=A0A2M9D734_9MICO|nr:VOC family protein [Salinibacterium amurskyense]PJJ81313.1 catechol 2,3-dioxygenase [Salinibacterium amurskyense]RLQ83321.1 VOC family protein [Salinibacterium amurskyense]GHD80932.1 glyoxalase [Salinibacterium amurskyense]